MTEKRFKIDFDGHQYFLVIDEVNESCLARLDTRFDALAWLEIYKMLSEENKQLKHDATVLIQSNMDYMKENEELKKENQRMTDKLNELALEFLNYDMVSMGKATEISEMCYYDFLKYRKDNGNPMELQL